MMHSGSRFQDRQIQAKYKSVTNKIPGFHTDLKKVMYKCMYQLIDSVAIVALTVPTLSDKKILLLLKRLNQLHVSVLFNDYCILVFSCVFF